MPIDYSGFAIPKGGKGGTRFDRKKQRKADQELHERLVHQAVDARDHHTCRLCGRYCSPLAIGLLERSHRHHLEYRSKGGATDTSNLLTLCASCHNDVHAGKVRLSGDADVTDKATGRLCGIKVERAGESGWRVEKHC
jgi:5-methylcytosine-specific restriction endonuclease McrA